MPKACRTRRSHTAGYARGTAGTFTCGGRRSRRIRAERGIVLHHLHGDARSGADGVLRGLDPSRLHAAVGGAVPALPRRYSSATVGPALADLRKPAVRQRAIIRTFRKNPRCALVRQHGSSSRRHDAPSGERESAAVQPVRLATLGSWVLDRGVWCMLRPNNPYAMRPG